RPQLLDRFGLAVDVQAERDIEVRAEVVRRRIAFDRDPEGFVRQWTDAEQGEGSRLITARHRLPDVQLDDTMLRLITGICMDFDVDGMRADITMYRAAIALAAYEGRTQVVEDEVRRVARLVLPHRRRRQPFDQPGVDEQQLEDSLERHLPPQQDNQTTPAPSTPPADSQVEPSSGSQEEHREQHTAGLAPEDKQASIGQPYHGTPLEGLARQAGAQSP